MSRQILRNGLALLLLAGGLSRLPVCAQAVPVVQDTLRPVVPQDPVADSIRVGESVLDNTNTPAVGPAAAPLSKRQEQIRLAIVPRKATIRSLILPGLGQLYNRDYWKIPLVYAGIGTALYFLIDNNGQYLRYENAYREAFNDTTNGRGNGTALIYIRSRKSEQKLGVAQLKRATNIYRGYRDLNVIILVAVWALNVVEANVAAHLKTFDLSDDLTLRVQPNLHPTGAGTTAPGVRLTINWKK